MLGVTLGINNYFHQTKVKQFYPMGIFKIIKLNGVNENNPRYKLPKCTSDDLNLFVFKTFQQNAFVVEK